MFRFKKLVYIVNYFSIQYYLPRVLSNSLLLEQSSALKSLSNIFRICVSQYLYFGFDSLPEAILDFKLNVYALLAKVVALSVGQTVEKPQGLSGKTLP